MDQKKLLIRLKNVLSKKLAVQKIYIFGSRAKGTFFSDSDYDMAIVSQDFDGMSFFNRQRFIRPLVRKVLGVVPIDVACYTPEEFKRGKKAFLPKIIVEEGISV